MIHEIKEQERGIELIELIFLIKKKAIYILLAGVLMGAAGYFASKHWITPVYEASSTMIVNTRIDQNAMVTNDQITSAENLVDTYAIIIQSGRVLKPVINKLDLDISEKNLQSKITVTQINDTQVMRIAVRDADPDLAYKILSEIIEVAPDIIIDTVEAGSVKTIEHPSVTDAPVAPDIRLNTLLSALIGAAVSGFYFVLKFVLDNTFKSEMDIQVCLALPVLGVIPNVEKMKEY